MNSPNKRQIGKTIKTELLQDDRSEYGQTTLKHLAQRLQQEYGAGFSYSNLTRMIKFYSFMPEQTIVATLSQQLSWSHFISFPRRCAHLYTQVYKLHVIPDCRNPGSMDGLGLPSKALDTRFPAGMASYLEIVYNDEGRCVGTI